MEETQSNKPANTQQKPYNLDPNVEAALAYLIPPITSIVIYMLEKENKYIMFHAMQGILFGASFIILYFLLIFFLFFVPFIDALLVSLLGLIGFVLWLILIWKAYQNEEWELPVLGKMAREQINK